MPVSLGDLNISDPSYTNESGVNAPINTITSVDASGVATVVFTRAVAVRNTYTNYVFVSVANAGTDNRTSIGTFGAWTTVGAPATPDTQPFLNEIRSRVDGFTRSGITHNESRTCTADGGCDGPFTRVEPQPNVLSTQTVTESRNNVTTNPSFIATFTTANAEALISFSVSSRGIVSLSVSGTLNGASFTNGQNLGRQQDVTTRTLTGNFVVPSGFTNTGGTVPVSISVSQLQATFLVSDLGPGNCGVGQSGAQVFGTFNFGSATYTGDAIAANTACQFIVHTLPFTVSGSIPVGFVNATNPFSFDVTCTGNQQSLPEYDSDDITTGCSVSGNGAISVSSSPVGTILNRSASPSGANNTGSPRTVTVTFDWTGTTPSTFCDAGSSALFTGLTCVATQPVAVACRNISAVSQIGGYTLCDGNTQFLNPSSSNGLNFCYEDGQANLTYTTTCT